MTRLDRRRWLQTSLAATALPLGADGLLHESRADEAPARKKKRVAAAVTVYKNNSHADVLIGKILEGFRQDGGPGPDLELVSLYVDQVPKSDMSQELAAKHGFQITESIEEAITLGGKEVAVDGVICVAEHGDYPSTPDTNQRMYPRRRFFDEVTATFKKCDQVVPLFNDKHLSYNWKDGKHMYETARSMQIPFMAGSSLPLGWRIPPLELPMGCEISSALSLGYGGLESYGFHALEGLQCMVERRKGGETGVVAVQAASGEEISKAANEGRWSPELIEALKEVTTPARKGRPRELTDQAVVYLIEYRDGLRAAVAMKHQITYNFSFAAQLKGQAKPVATFLALEEVKPFGHFAYLLRAIEHMIHTGRPAYPVERTVITTGALDALLHSHAEGGKRIETPELDISYKPTDWPYAAGVPGDEPVKT